MKQKSGAAVRGTAIGETTDNSNEAIHDLNTPLHAVLATATELLKKDVPEDIRRLIQINRTAGLELKTSIQKHLGIYGNGYEQTRLTGANFNSDMDFSHFRVLAVDDSLENLLILQMYLKRTGARVDLATSGAHAIDLFSKSFYDLVLMDIAMPGISGLTTATVIRQMEIEKRLPMTCVFAVTAHTEIKKQPEAEDLFDNFIFKPFEPSTLFKKISEHFTEPSVLKTVPEDSEIKSQPQEASQKEDEKSQREEPVEVSDFVAELIPTFIKNKLIRLQNAKSDFSNSDWLSVSRFGHELKGDGPTYGFYSLGKLGKELESLAKENKPSVDRIEHLLDEVNNLLERARRNHGIESEAESARAGVTS